MSRAAVLLVAIAPLLASCGPEEGRRRARSPDAAPRATHASGTPSEGEASFDAAAAPSSRTLRIDRFATVALPSSPPDVEPRPRRRRHVDVDLVGAPFDDTARMLADVGGFGLVLEAPGASPVQASLRQVDAWEALVAICQAKGLDLRYEGGIAIVKAR